MSYEMYEDFKETMVKTIKTELAAKTADNNQSSDNDLSQRIGANRIYRTRAASGDNNPACRTIGEHRAELYQNANRYR